MIDEQQIIQLSCIRDINLDSFVEFINAIKYRCMLTEELLYPYLVSRGINFNKRHS